MTEIEGKRQTMRPTRKIKPQPMTAARASGNHPVRSATMALNSPVLIVLYFRPCRRAWEAQ